MTQVQNLSAVQLQQKMINELQNTPKGYSYLLREAIEDNVELNTNKEESKAFGVAAGATSFAGLAYASKKILDQFPEKLKKFAGQVKVDEGLVNKILNRTGLSKAGVKLDNYAKGVPVSMTPRMEKIVSAIKDGKNAAYNTINKSVMVNLDKAGGTVFHEIGHAVNANKTKFWKSLQKVRLFALLAPIPLFLTAMFKSKKADGEKPVGFWDKTTTFIKENVGKLTTLAFVPIIAEELRATNVGNKLAKAVLDPKQFKQVVKSNKIGAASYITAAVLGGFATMFATKVRDKVARKD